MRHGIKDDVDAHGIGLGFGKVPEIKLILAFAFPAIAEVGDVAADRHHAILIVKDTLVLHLATVVRTGSGKSDASAAALLARD